MMKLFCDQCAEEMPVPVVDVWVKQDGLEQGRQFCSRACATAWLSEGRPA